MDPAALEGLLAFGWPGNVRELQNAVKSAVLLCDGCIEPRHLPAAVRQGRAGAAGALKETSMRSRAGVEEEMVRSALLECEGNRSAAASKLGIDRKTLYAKMRTYGIEVTRRERTTLRRE
jgi:two-component system response regulator HydG